MRSRMFVPVFFITIASMSGAAQKVASDPVALSSGIVAGHILSKPAPPNLCVFRGEGGWTARVVIDTNGLVAKASMLREREGGPIYLAWIRQLRYRPFEQDGRPVAVASTVTVNVGCGG